MVPRMHKRGSSFKWACQYVLHDPGEKSSDRVRWELTQNLGNLHPEDVWFAMYETWRDRTSLKRAAGLDLRGRDNKAPVLHYSLSWAHEEKPSDEHMKETALSSLKALKLEGHQALIVAHADKEHVHVHVVVNTVNPDTGRTAPLKYTKMAFSRWAEAYEREHGIHCQQRIDNNEERARIAAEREDERKRIESAKTQGLPAPQKAPYKPVKAKSLPRNNWMSRKIVIDRMKRLRAELDHRHMVERDVTWSRQREERAELTRDAKAAAIVATDYVRDRFKGRWRELYRAQREEAAHVTNIQGNLFERAVFVFKNSERLGNGPPLSWRKKFQLIRSPAKLMTAVERLHTRERREMGMIEKVEIKERLDRVWQNHEHRIEGLRARQFAERQTERDGQKAKAKDSISYVRARNQLILEREHGRETRMAEVAPPRETDVEYTERIRAEIEAFRERNIGIKPSSPRAVEPAEPGLSETFAEAQLRTKPVLPPEPAVEPRAPGLSGTFAEAAGSPLDPSPSRAEEIKRDMAEWKKRNQGRDFGRDM